MAARRKLKTFTIAAVLLLAGCAHPHVYVPRYIPRPNRIVEYRYMPAEHTTHVTVEAWNQPRGQGAFVEYWEFEIHRRGNWLRRVLFGYAEVPGYHPCPVVMINGTPTHSEDCP